MVNAVHLINFIFFLSFMGSAYFSFIAPVFSLFGKDVKKHVLISMRLSLLFFSTMLVLCSFLLFLFLNRLPEPFELRPIPSTVAQIVNLCVPLMALQIVLMPIIFRKTLTIAKWIHIGIATISIVGFILLFCFIRTQVIPEMEIDLIWWF